MAKTATEPEGDPARPEPDAPRPRRRRWLRWVLEALVVVAALFAIRAWQTRAHPAGGTPAPAFALRDLDGRVHQLASYRGKRVQLHFWATWCGVCKRELGTLGAVHEGLGEDEVLLTIVEDSDDHERVRAFVREHGIRYPVLLGTPEVVRAYRVGAFPTNYFIDANGAIRSTDVGMATRWGMRTRLGCAR